MAVECAFAVRGAGTRDVGADFGDDGCTEGDVGDEVTVHYVDAENMLTSRVLLWREGKR